MEKITITQSRYDELLKKEFAVEALKAYIKNQTGYINSEVINAILDAIDPKPAYGIPEGYCLPKNCEVDSNADDF